MVKICPVNSKFAEELTHRDYLGAILNLGIDRSTTGDILPVLDANSTGVSIKSLLYSANSLILLQRYI